MGGMRKHKTDHRIQALREYIDETGTAVRDIAYSIGITESSIYGWLRGAWGVSRLASPRLDQYMADHKIVVPFPELEARISGGKR